MGKKMYQTKTWSSVSYPQGCWLWTSSGMMYWNNNKGSQKHSSTIKICRDMGGMSEVSYVFMNKGSNVCASGSRDIVTYDRCAMAAKAAGNKKMYDNRSWSSTSYPYGCWVWTNGKYYWNNQKSSKTHTSTVKVCWGKGGSQPTKAPTTQGKFAMMTKGSNVC